MTNEQYINKIYQIPQRVLDVWAYFNGFFNYFESEFY